MEYLHNNTHVTLGKSKISDVFKRLREEGIVENEVPRKLEMVTFPSCRHKERADLVKFIREHHEVTEDSRCYTCQSIHNAREDVACRNKAIEDQLVAASDVKHYEWPNKTLTVNLQGIMTNACNFQLDVQNCMRFCDFCGKKICVKHIHVDLPPPIMTVNKMYAGGKFLEDFEFAEGQTIECPMDGTFGLVTWDVDSNHQDFAIIAESYMDNGSIYHVSREEASRIEEMRMYKRSGPAGGFVIPSQLQLFDRMSCTPCTKQRRMFLRMGEGRSTDCPLVYVNPKTGSIAKFSQLYNDVYMTKLTPTEKREKLRMSMHWRVKSICEMESRLQALAIVEHLGLYKKSKNKNPLMQALKATLCKLCDAHVVDFWRVVDPQLSMWEITMLEYSCSTGTPTITRL